MAAPSGGFRIKLSPQLLAYRNVSNNFNVPKKVDTLNEEKKELEEKKLPSVEEDNPSDDDLDDVEEDNEDDFSARDDAPKIPKVEKKSNEIPQNTQNTLKEVNKINVFTTKNVGLPSDNPVIMIRTGIKATTNGFMDFL